MSILNNSLLLAAPAGSSTYQITRSLRFSSGDSSYLSRTPSVAGNRKTWTWSAWVKRTVKNTSTDQMLFAGGATSSDTGFLALDFNSSDKLRLSSAATNFLITTAVYRDAAAWMHIVLAFDATQGTNASKVKLYVNGTEVTAFDTDGRSSIANQDYGINQAAVHEIGRATLGSNKYFDGYIADPFFIDGQALDPSSFTTTDPTTGQLIPVAYSGSYGTNGFHLPFSDNSATTATTLGKDTSPNGNNWSCNNFSVTAGAGNDSLVDTPTSYGTDTGAGGEVRGNYATLNPLDGSPAGLSNGNLDAASANAYPTIIPGNGSWYYEVNGTGYNWDGTKANWTPRAGSHNFGQRAFSSTAPSSFKALCDTNLAPPLIAKSDQVFQATLWTGNGGSQSISSLSFSPDFVWIKARSAGTTSHCLFDTIRGTTKGLHSDQTIAEWTDTATLTAFNSNGFTLAGHPYTNGNGTTYVGWTWDAGSAANPTTNTQGSIISSVRANQSAGFSIVTYTGTGSAATVGHGLGVAPSLLIVKQRNAVRAWEVYHKDLGASYYLEMNVTNAKGGPYSGLWNDTAPTSTVFSIKDDGGVNQSTGTYVAYCFAPVAGYSSFGSYTGNGSADGPFVYTGHRSRWVLIKDTGSGNWRIYDTARDLYNQATAKLYPNSSTSENGVSGETASTNTLDVLSNGFKLRTSNSETNFSGNTYIWASFAENPFQYARAR